MKKLFPQQHWGKNASGNLPGTWKESKHFLMSTRTTSLKHFATESQKVFRTLVTRQGKSYLN